MAKAKDETTKAEAAKTETKAPGILTKITVSTMGCNPGEAKAKNAKVSVAKITGAASGIKATVGKDGDAVTGLTGRFFAVNTQTGEYFESGVLFLPAGLAELLINAVVGDGALDEESKRPIYNTVEFGFELFAIPAKNPIGYSYEGRTLIEAKANPERDRFISILNGGSAPKQIAAE